MVHSKKNHCNCCKNGCKCCEKNLNKINAEKCACCKSKKCECCKDLL